MAACSSFTDCVNDPLKDNGLTTAINNFKDLTSTSIYSVNLVLFLLQAVLVVFVVWSIFKGIYAIIGADSSESFEKLRGAITNAVFAAVGIVFLVGSKFIFVVVLRLFGIADVNNPFL